jgi:hypothetical protein
MKSFIFALVLVFSTLCFAQTGSVSKADIEKSLKQMEASGMFTPAQVKAARAQLEGMTDTQVNALTQQAHAKASDPKVQAQAKALAEKIKNNPDAQKMMLEKVRNSQEE